MIAANRSGNLSESAAPWLFLANVGVLSTAGMVAMFIHPCPYRCDHGHNEGFERATRAAGRW